MKYKILFPLLVSGLFFNACSKKDSTTNAPGDTVLDSYYSGPAMEIKELAIYTNGTVITNPQIIQDFINRNVSADAKSQFYVGLSSAPFSSSTIVLNFLNDNRVNINGINMQIVGSKDSVMAVSEYTSLPIPTFSSSCTDLLSKVPEYSPFSNCPSGNCALYHKTTAIIVEGANYYLPLLTYAVVTNECAASLDEIPAINIKSLTLKSKLAAGDSVLVQYAKLPLIKKAKN